jgi:hypothetical protein
LNMPALPMIDPATSRRTACRSQTEVPLGA